MDDYDARTIERIRRTVAVNAASGCWEWTGAVNAWGYARIGYRRKSRAAHRISYILHKGAPPHRDIDHLCRNRRCVNPDHLESVPHAVNVRRGIGPTAVNAAKTHCVQGHPLSGENLIRRPTGHRGCRTCNEAALARFHARRKQGGR